MAKKVVKKVIKKNKSVAKEIDNINNSVNSILQQYKTIPKKEKAKIIKDLKTEQKKHLKDFKKSGSIVDNIRAKSKELSIKKIDEFSERINIKYSNFNFKVKSSYFEKIKDKERYLDYLYSRKVKRAIEKLETPKTKAEANELQALITIYNKKVGERDFYDSNFNQYALNKLKTFHDGLNNFYYSDYVKKLKNGTLKKGSEEAIYKIVERPITINGFLIGLEFNFF